MLKQSNKYIKTRKQKLLRCMLKTCKSRKYKSVYGITTGGNIRTPRQLFY